MTAPLGLTAEVADLLLQGDGGGVGLAVVDHHDAACGGEPAHKGRTDPQGTACHQYCAALRPAHSRLLPIRKGRQMRMTMV